MRCLQRTQRIQKYNTHPDRVCSPCFSLAKDTEVSSGIQPDYGAASFPWLWDSSVHHKDLILRSRCCTKDSNITVALQFLNPCHLKNGNKYSLYLVTGFTVTPFLSWIFLASSAHISGGRNSDMRRGGKQRSLTNWDICRGRSVLEFFWQATWDSSKRWSQMSCTLLAGFLFWRIWWTVAEIPEQCKPDHFLMWSIQAAVCSACFAFILAWGWVFSEPYQISTQQSHVMCLMWMGGIGKAKISKPAYISLTLLYILYKYGQRHENTYKLSDFVSRFLPLPLPLWIAQPCDDRIFPGGLLGFLLHHLHPSLSLS